MTDQPQTTNEKTISVCPGMNVCNRPGDRGDFCCRSCPTFNRGGQYESEAAQAAWEKIHGTHTTCPHCGNSHVTKCPLVKAYEYHPNGTLKRVEFYAPNDYGPLTVVRQAVPPGAVPYVYPTASLACTGEALS